MSRGTLVGRDRPLARLEVALADSIGGRGGVVLVAGEAGVGKTALVATFADLARAGGAAVVTGACWPGAGTPGYWPWVQVLRQARELLPAGARRQPAGSAGAAVDRLLEGGAPPSSPAGDGDERFRVADAVTTVLVEASRSRPVLVVLEDLHWADAASVHVLEFAARHLGGARLLLVATYRADEVTSPGHPMRELHRGGVAAIGVVDLPGLGAEAVGDLLARLGHGDRPADEVWRRTGGNPFYVQQLARLWDAGGADDGLPPGIAATLRRRLGVLSSACADLLLTAALVGSSVDIEVLATCHGSTAGGTSDLVAEAVRARLATRDGARVGFVHDLVREALLAETDEADRRRRRADVVRRAGAAGSLSAGELAMHAFLARPDVPADEAVDLLVAAAAEASARLAFDEAADHRQRVLVLLVPGSPAWRSAALSLAAAQRLAGRLDAARQTLGSVVGAARSAADAPALAAAALGLHELGSRVDVDRPRLAALLDEALEALRSQQASAPTVEARLLAAAVRARTHVLADERSGLDELADEAVALARRCGDPSTLAFCLLARHDAIWRPGTAAARLATAEEMADLADESGDVEMGLQARLLSAVALLETGDHRALAAVVRYAEAAERAALPRARYLARSRRGTLAMLQGRFDEARDLVDAAAEMGAELGEIDAVGVWSDQRMELARLRGVPEELDALIEVLRARDDPHVLTYEAARALDSGDLAAAVDAHAALHALGLRWPRWAELVWLVTEAEIVATGSDREAMAALRHALARYEGSWAVLGGGVLVRGPIVLWRAVLDRSLGSWDEAIQGFAEARRAAQALGAVPWELQARLGEVLARAERGDVGDEAALAGELAEVARLADGLGMLGLARQARAAVERVGAQAPTGVFQREGDVWVLTYGGATVRVPDAKGLHDLRTLLARPGAAVAAVDLLHPTDLDLGAAVSRLGADPVLDQRALDAYRRRLAALDDQIAVALDRGADAAAKALDEERAALVDELRAATGLGGRSRRLGAESERARKTVTARIRDIERRLALRHPALASHLREHVTTGTFCSYRPDGRTTWVTGDGP